MRYSDRKGYTKVKTEITKETLDTVTCNRLWNIFLYVIWYNLINEKKEKDLIGNFILQLWHNHFKIPIDSFSTQRKTYEFFRNKFLKPLFLDNITHSYKLFNLIEYIASNYPIEEVKQAFIKGCNKVLTEELSDSRIVGGRIVEMTSEEEKKEIEEVLSLKDSLEPVKIHIETAIDLLKQKTVDGYRNSIKESISAVEAICRKINNDSKMDLSIALKTIEQEIEIHPAFKKALVNLYGWTSDESGVRHCLMNESNLDADDAKFMIVICSAFINYLKGKASNANIKL